LNFVFLKFLPCLKLDPPHKANAGKVVFVISRQHFARLRVAAGCGAVTVFVPANCMLCHKHALMQLFRHTKQKHRQPLVFSTKFGNALIPFHFIACSLPLTLAPLAVGSLTLLRYGCNPFHSLHPSPHRWLMAVFPAYAFFTTHS
jgi:hypothetical protein